MVKEYHRLLKNAKQHLGQQGAQFDSGLSVHESEEAELRFQFKFPPDLRHFLELTLPVGERFPTWRKLDGILEEQFAWPLEGICFDVRNRVFWWKTWGDRPESDEEAVAIATRNFQQLPKLIPIYGHCYLPSFPLESGNPVFSVHQADVIHRGANLSEFLLSLFREEADNSKESLPVFSESYRTIEFWTEIARQNA